MGRVSRVFLLPSRESTRDGERKRIILATLFRRPDQIPIFFAFGSRNIGRKGDSDSTPVQIEFRFSILSSRCPENYARTTIDSFFELHKHSFPSSSNEIFHLPLLADTSDFSNLLHGSRFYREMPRHFMEAFFLCDRSLADGTNNGSTPHPLTRQTSKIENTGIRRRKRAVVIDWWM